MSNSFNLPYQCPPLNYSGVTIQVANPTMNATPFALPYMSQQQYCCPNHVTNPLGAQPQFSNTLTQPTYTPTTILPATVAQPSATLQEQHQPQLIPQASIPVQAPAYPAQYYLNNYNYVQDTQKPTADIVQAKSNTEANLPLNNNQSIKKDKISNNEPENVNNNSDNNNKQDAKFKPTDEIQDNDLNNINEMQNLPEDKDLTTSKEIIDSLDARAEEIKEQEKNAKKTKVVALTNEYIMSLENYLNNPNSDIRLMASKEVLTRLDEDRTRFDDAALNALLNKMLQDPDKLVRIAALSALSSQLASGNDFTVQLLHQIQQNPNSDKEDVLQVADILLKMSTQTEEKSEIIPQTNINPEPQVKQGA